MPFPFKIRGRTQRYSVLSKNSFLTRIQLLDNNVIEYTRPVDSTGQDCLEDVAQKLQLRETQYFGLWFLSKSHLQRWVDLEKTLKKQLDKFASETLLYFGVMFYVPNISRLEHKVTRYQYYLQSKKDILSRRLQCCFETAVRLAGLAVQVDFGDFDQFQSPDYLTDYALFPVNWTGVSEEKWTQKVTTEHKQNRGMSPPEAILLYVKEVEKLDGFGKESFAVKDSYANVVFLGVSFTGVFVKNKDGRSLMLHRWNDIRTITHNRSTIAVEILSKDDTITFHTDDVESAKYIAKLFTARRKFYEQNNILGEVSHSPLPIRTTWDWSAMARRPSYTLQLMHPRHGGFYQEPQRSLDNTDGPYHESESSMDHCPVDYSFQNGTGPNGSLNSTPSTNSLNRSQTFIQTSPISSSLSIQSSDVMAPEYVPVHRHPIVAPSYRHAPDYESVMQQKRLAAVAGCGRQSLCVHPEMTEWAPYPSPCNSPVAFNLPVGTAAHVNLGCSYTTKTAEGSTIAYTVSTSDLAHARPLGTQCHSTTHTPRDHQSGPLPPYCCSRPTASSPDLANSHLRDMGDKSPELVSRKVQLSVKTFHSDSSPMVHHPPQETSEHLRSTRSHVARKQRHSLEVMSSMVQGMEAMTLRALNAPLVRRNTLREQPAPHLSERPIQKTPENLPSYQHARNLSSVTMLTHGSGSEEAEMPSLGMQVPRVCHCSISPHLRAPRARLPSKPPPEYPGLGRVTSNEPGVCSSIDLNKRSNLTQLVGSTFGPSISEPNLASVKERVKKKVLKERPVSEMFSIQDSIVEREIMQRMREKQKMEMDSLSRPLKMAAQNSFYSGSVVLSENQQTETVSVSFRDELVRAGYVAHTRGVNNESPAHYSCKSNNAINPM